MSYTETAGVDRQTLTMVTSKPSINKFSRTNSHRHRLIREEPYENLVFLPGGFSAFRAKGVFEEKILSLRGIPAGVA